MKTIINYFLVMIFLFSCSKDDNSVSCFTDDSAIQFSVKNEQGVDLLNPSNENSYKESLIDIYWIIDGVKTRIHEANLDCPEFFRIDANENNEYFFTLFLNTNVDENNRSITYIKWNDIEEDKFECEFRKGENYIIRHKVWYNGLLVYNMEEDTIGTYFEMIK